MCDDRVNDASSLTGCDRFLAEATRQATVELHVAQVVGTLAPLSPRLALGAVVPTLRRQTI